MLLAENVQDYPRPPALERVEHRLRIVLGDRIVAETTKALRVLETHHAPTYYFPPGDIQANLIAEQGTSFCEWKGSAQYWTVVSGAAKAAKAAWSYPSPVSDYAALKDHIAFYAGLMDACYVGDVQVMPQPGDFYGGWTTPNLTGHIKGAPGTRHW